MSPGPETRPRLSAEIRETVRLAAPVALAQMSFVTMNLVDTAFVGPLGAEPLAAVALGTSLYFAPAIFLIGLVSAVGPIVAQRFGAGDLKGVRQTLEDGWWVALGIGLLGTAGLLFLARYCGWVGVEPGLVEPTANYLAARSVGIVPALLFIAYKCYLEGQGTTVPALVIILAANVVNALANWVLVYGHLGAPALGVTGSGLATSLSNLFQFVCAAYFVRHSRFRPAPDRRPTREGMRQLLRIGVPMGMHQGLEVGIFALAAILMNLFGAVPMAAHQIAIQLASTSFMVAVGCSVAASTRVGQELGRGRPEAAERAGWLSIAVGVSFMACSAVVFLTLNEQLVGLFTRDAAVVAVGASLLKIAGVFQLSDGVQAVTSGALRGAGDTRFSLYASMTGYWLVGLPLCGLLGFELHGGPQGLWWALTAALTVTAILLLARFHNGGWKKLQRL